MQRLSNLDDDELMRYVGKIRRIAKMDDRDAMIEVDELIHDLALHGLDDSDFASDFGFDIDIPISGQNVGLDEAKEYLQKYHRNLENYRKNMRGEYESTFLRSNVEGLGDDWPDSVKEALQDDLIEAKREANEVLDLNECLYYSIVIQAQGKERLIYNTQTVRSILDHLANAETRLQEMNALTDDLQQKLRQGRERCAWFRTKIKLWDVQLAENSGKRTRAFRLRKEAQALLKQDWQKIFPTEQCPDI